MLFCNSSMINLYVFLSDFKTIIHNIVRNLSPYLSQYIRNILIYVLRKGINARAAAISIQRANGIEARSYWSCFFPFQSWNLSLEDEPFKRFRSFYYRNSAITAKELTEKFNACHTTFLRQLKKIEKDVGDRSPYPL